MIKLNAEINVEQPKIINKPFSCLYEMLNNIVDIDDDEHFKGAKERLEISKKQVKKAIQQFEEGKVETTKKIKETSEIDLLKKEIINLGIKENYRKEDIERIENNAKKLNNKGIDKLLAGLYSSWGVALGNLAKTKKGKEAEELFNQAFEKYQKAVEIKPDFNEAFNNWGVVLGNLAETKKGKEAEELFNQAFEKYQKAVEINPNTTKAFYNWGTDLGNLAKTKKGKEAEELFNQALEKYQKAVEIKPDSNDAFNNWGVVLGNLARTKKGKEAEELYNQAFEKYQKAVEIKPDFNEAFNNWGIYLGNLAKTKKGKEAEEMYNQAFEKYQKAVEINPKNSEIFYNWASDLAHLAKTKKGKEAEDLYNQSHEKANQCHKLGGKSYNLSCIYALHSDKEKALFYLNKSLEKGEITTDFVREDEDWKNYLEDQDFNKILNKYKNKAQSI